MEIGIISEGESDQIVVEAIIQKTFHGNKDIILDPLQPKLGQPGGWPLVVSYCGSDEFKSAFPYKDIIVVHIDADVLKGSNTPEDYKLEFNGLSTEESFDLVKSFLINKIGEFYETQKEKIIFAIAIDQIECWFLPVYFPTQRSFRNKTTGAIKQLNKVLPELEGFYINSKDRDYFITMSKRFFNKGVLEHCIKTNESFSLFHEQLIPHIPLKE